MLPDPRDQLIEELRATIARLEAKVADLEEKLRKSSSNSSKPPSSDGPATPRSKPARRKRSGKKRGAQPGHTKRDRLLVPIAEVDAIADVKPEKCGACDARLHGEDPEPDRHQVVELPVVKPLVTEYRLHALVCRCGHVTCAELPAAVPRGAFGPGVVATVAVLIGAYRLSTRLTAALLHDLMGLNISLGSVIKCQREALAALTPCVQEVAEHVQAAPVKHADETSWRQAGARAWLWTVVTPLVTFFTIQSTRSAEAARFALGATLGVLVSDRFSGYENRKTEADRVVQHEAAKLTLGYITSVMRRDGKRSMARGALAVRLSDAGIAWRIVERSLQGKNPHKDDGEEE